jgi:hypothetical protein
VVMNVDPAGVGLRKHIAARHESARTNAGECGLRALAPILIPPFPRATLGKRPGFQATVLDQKYWFGKLYELVTYQELSYSTHTDYPGFSLHFMKVFYGMYYNALQNFQKQVAMQVGPLLTTHFNGPPPVNDKPVEPDSMEAIEYSVQTGAIAHIQGDMPVALVTAYKTWTTDSKPKFEDLKGDFIDKSEGAFKAAQGAFYIEVNDKTFSPEMLGKKQQTRSDKSSPGRAV